MNYKATLDNDIFEAMMKNALIERYSNEVDSLMTEPEEKFSESFERKAGKIIRKVGINEQAENIGKIAAKSFSVALIVLGISFVFLLTQPKVYAAVCDVIRSVFSDHDSYSSDSFTSDTDGVIFNNSIVPPYIPEGYKLRKVFYGDFNVDLVYENEDNLDIHYSYGTKDGTKISVNNERVEFSERRIGGTTYYIYNATVTDDDNTVIFCYDEYIFVIDSQLSVDEIIKIAESVQEVQ